MKKILIILIILISFIFGDGGWIEAAGKEISDHELSILIKEEYAPLLGIEPKLELSSIAVLDIAVSGFSTKEFDPLFHDYELFTQSHRDYNLHRYYTLRIDPQEDFTALIDAILNAPEIELVEYKYKANLLTTIPNDPLYPQQWSHHNNGQAVGEGFGVSDCDMDTDEAWDITTGDSDVIIAILDTGIDMGHPEFTDRILSPWDYYDGDDNPADYVGHGTSCAGIAAARGNNAEGIAGICWECSIIPVKVCEAMVCYPDYIADGILYAHDHGADVISMSFGFYASSSPIRDAINYAYDHGTILFAATGNGNTEFIQFPAAEENCIAVGAHSPCNERKHPASCDGDQGWGSNFGEGIDFLAPTIVITTDVPPGPTLTRDYTVFDGTSASCPHAAGVAGLILSVNSQLPPVQVREIMQVTSVDLDANGGLGSDGYDIYNGYGRINAHHALENVLSQKYFHAGWNWAGFPVLLDNEDGIVNNNPDPVTDIFNEIEQNISSIYIEQPAPGGINPSSGWDGYEWDLSGELETVNSLAGYFVEMPDDQPYYQFPIMGERIAEDYPVELDVDENWIPYFIPEYQHPNEAFPQEVLDHMTALYSEHWFMICRDGELIIKSPCPDAVEGFDCYHLRYGAMYKVVMSSAMTFTWNNPMENGAAATPGLPQTSENFPYELKKDYIPLVVEGIENGQDIVEIGVVQNNEYIGAELVGGYPINLRVYAGDLNDISFEVITSGDPLGKPVDKGKAHLTLRIRNKRTESGITFAELGQADQLIIEAPEIFSPVQTYPNPFNPGTNIRYHLNRSSFVELNIFDLQGRQITTLLSGQLQQGPYSATWNGTDDTGNSVSSGVYFYRLHGADDIIQSKIMFLK